MPQRGAVLNRNINIKDKLPQVTSARATEQQGGKCLSVVQGQQKTNITDKLHSQDTHLTTCKISGHHSDASIGVTEAMFSGHSKHVSLNW